LLCLWLTCANISGQRRNKKGPAWTKPCGAVNLGGGALTPRGGTSLLRAVGVGGPQCRHGARTDFKLALTRAIEPTGGPGVELAALDSKRAAQDDARTNLQRRHSPQIEEHEFISQRTKEGLAEVR
jgi:hypothetical protein